MPPDTTPTLRELAEEALKLTRQHEAFCWATFFEDDPQRAKALEKSDAATSALFAAIDQQEETLRRYEKAIKDLLPLAIPSDRWKCFCGIEDYGWETHLHEKTCPLRKAREALDRRKDGPQ